MPEPDPGQLRLAAALASLAAAAGRAHAAARMVTREDAARARRLAYGAAARAGDPARAQAFRELGDGIMSRRFPGR